MAEPTEQIDPLACEVVGINDKRNSGRLTFFGTDITFRSQTHGSFKLLFNSLLQAGADPE